MIRPAHIRPITQEAARLMLDWRYPPPYDIYNFSSDDPVDVQDTLAYLLEPENQFFEIVDTKQRILGFCSFGQDGQVPGGNYSQSALDIGMGIRPDLTGQGLGSRFASAVVTYGAEKFHPVLFRVTIAAFNERAKRVWQRLGFQPVQEFVHLGTKRPFIIFTRQG